MKMILETRKIMNLPKLKITATTVRIPTMGGHSESINAEFESQLSMNEVFSALENAPGIVVQDNPQEKIYPMPLTAHDKDAVFVGRLRLDESHDNTLNMWVVSDNLRKGAATNAVQIAESLLKKGWI
jgi:aspartate-semialdehyde dehydrogenase